MGVGEMIYIVYFAVLGVVAACLMRMGRQAMFRTGTTLLIIWIAGQIMIAWTGNPAPWLWLSILDFIGAMFVTIRPASRTQCAIGGLYVAALVCHAAFAINLVRSAAPDVNLYAGLLDRLTLIQGALFMLWMGGRGVSAVFVPRVRGHHLPAASPDMASLV